MRTPENPKKLQDLKTNSTDEVKLSEATKVIIYNNNLSLQIREQLKSLQEWVKTQESLFNSSSGKSKD